MNLQAFEGIGCMQERMRTADHMDVKTGEGDVSLRDFVAGVLSYRPGWIQCLYEVRRWTLRMLGFEVDLTHADDVLTGETLSVKSGENATFFEVIESDGESYWVAEAPESHLAAVFCVVAEPLAGGGSRFHALTTVHYHNFMGRLEFNMVRPFHHLLIAMAMRSVLKGRG